MLREEEMNIYEIMNYFKSLSSSGIELEFLSLSTFDLDQTQQKKKLMNPKDFVTYL